MAYISLADSLFRVGRYGEGIEALKRGLLIKPNHPIAITVVSQYAIENYERAEAEGYVRRALANPQVDEGNKIELRKMFRTRYGDVVR